MEVLDRLREEYKKSITYKRDHLNDLRKSQYRAVRSFALDCNLVSFQDVERMEYDVNTYKDINDA